MKKIIAALLIPLILIGIALFWLSGNLDNLVKDAIEKYGSAMTQAKVSVGSVKITPGDGRGVISNLTIGNPAGFKTTHLLKVDQIDVAIDIASVATNVILIRHIAVNAPDVIYEKGDTMTNIDALQKNIGAYLGAPDNNKKEGKKLIVEELSVRDAKAQASAAFMNGKTVSAALPDITMKDIGRAKGGITPGELGQEIAAEVKAKLTGAFSFDRMLKATSELLDKTGSAIKGLFK
ncbi:MAG: hypothetical protein K2P67_01210 [Gallionellaceae bacterium]|nr:hypothetical protein [Gallionellaceae bacterium]